MKLELCHTLSTETIQIDVPEAFANDLEHVVVIKDGEAFQLKSTIPDEIKKKNDLRKQFENNEFEYLRTTYYLDLDENADPDDFEEDFVNHAKNLVYGNYPELQAIIDESASNESIYHTICVHFVVYAVCKNREEKMNQKNESQKSDRCYAKDYAKRLLNLFRSLRFSEPGGMTKFSAELNDIEQFMQRDERRHAGYDKLFAGITATVSQLANVFITNDGEQRINLVKAFEEVAQGEDNPDRKQLISKVSSIIDSTITYYENYILNLDKIEDDISTINEDVSLSYIAVARGIVTGFINQTDKFLNDTTPGPEHDTTFVTAARNEYKKNTDIFYSYIEDLMAAFDDATNNVLPESAFATNIHYIWFNTRKARNSEDGNWPVNLAKLFYDNFAQLFKDVPTNMKMGQKSN